MKDLTGQIFRMLTVLSLHGTRNYPGGGSRRLWLCQCECGVETIVAGNNLTSGHTTSCGSKKHQENYHGLTNTGIYHVWENMIARCTKPQHPSWKDYGGRGITVCERWMDFAAFHEDMVEGYQSGLEIDRENNNAGYTKENCRWVTRLENILNRRNTRHLTISGVTMAAKQWSRKTGVCYSKLLWRLNRGWPNEMAIQP
jgi:hypothetical protein